MTLEEFTLLEPLLAKTLKWFIGEDGIVDNVLWRSDGLYEVMLYHSPSWEVTYAIEARCHPHCRDGRKPVWVWEGHVCCVECSADPGHYYSTIHE